MRPARAVAVLREVVSIWPDSPPVLIGASALPDIGARKTEDLDLVVAVEQDDVATQLRARAGWLTDPGLPFRWTHLSGERLDIIPAGPSALATGSLTWPGGFEMNLAGLDLALAHWTEEPLGSDAAIRVAKPPVIALLKMVAFLDRPAERQRDLGDLAHLLETYVDAIDERRFEEDSVGQDFDSVAAYLLGLDLGRLCEPKHLALAERFLAQVEDDSSVYHVAMRRQGPASLRYDEAALGDRLRAFRKGLSTPRS